MADLTIEKVNEVYLRITTEPHIEYELRDRFTFEEIHASVQKQALGWIRSSIQFKN